MTDTLENLQVPIDSTLLADLQRLADERGESLQTLVTRAIVDLLQRQSGDESRRHVMDAYRKSLDRFDPLYEKLAR